MNTMLQVSCSSRNGSPFLVKVQIGDLVVSTGDHVQARTDLIQTLHSQYPLEPEYEHFQNQSYTKIAETLFETTQGQLPKSHDSDYDNEYIQNYKTRAIKGK